MDSFSEKFGDSISSALECFDRVIFKGHQPFGNEVRSPMAKRCRSTAAGQWILAACVRLHHRGLATAIWKIRSGDVHLME